MKRPIRPRRALLPVLLAAPWVACTSPDDTHEGTAVGNPGVVAFALAAATDLDVSDGESSLAGASLLRCAGGATTTLDPADAAGALDGGAQLDAPPGRWCGLTLEDLELSFAGTESEGGGDDDDDDDEGLEFEVLLSIETLTVYADSVRGFDIAAAERFVLELGSPGWFSAELIGLGDADGVTIGPGDPEHDVLVAALLDQTTLFVDPDGDGRVAASERDQVAASAANPEPATFDGSGGCNAARGAALPWTVLSMLGAVVWRGRRRVPAR